MVYIFLANGFEELEAVAPIDIIRRAELPLKIVGVGGKVITGSHGINVIADISEEEVNLSEAELIILPGGMPGTLNIEKSAKVQEAIDHCVKNSIPIGAICAAPSILGHKSLLSDKEAIAFPGFETQLFGAKISEKYVVTDGIFTTARGAGVAVDFGLELVSRLKGREAANKIRAAIQCEKHG